MAGLAFVGVDFTLVDYVGNVLVLSKLYGSANYGWIGLCEWEFTYSTVLVKYFVVRTENATK